MVLFNNFKIEDQYYRRTHLCDKSRNTFTRSYDPGPSVLQSLCAVVQAIVGQDKSNKIDLIDW